MLGLGHKGRQGKDTAAFVLTESYPDAVRYSFADDLYAFCRTVYGMTHKDPDLLQRVGLALRESIGPDIWIRSVYARMQAEQPLVAVISDVRFQNEAMFVKEMGGELWQVVRQDPLTKNQILAQDRDSQHPSEIDLEGWEWDKTLVNPEGYPEIFRNRILKAYERIGMVSGDPDPA